MHWACAFGKPNIVKLLLEKDYKNNFLGDPEPGSLASRKAKVDPNALYFAIANRNRFVCKKQISPLSPLYCIIVCNPEANKVR